MKKLTSAALSITLSVIILFALCSCAPALPQLLRDHEAYYDYKIINDEDLMNIACIAGDGPYDTYTHEPIDFTPTVTFSPISDEEIQAIFYELYGNDDNVTLNENLFIYFFGEFHGYYALGIDYPQLAYPEQSGGDYFIGNISWYPSDKRYRLYIYTTPEKTKS